jgi:hypothetical protein
MKYKRKKNPNKKEKTYQIILLRIPLRVLINWVLGCPLGDEHSLGVLRLVGVLRVVAFLLFLIKIKENGKTLHRLTYD